MEDRSRRYITRNVSALPIDRWNQRYNQPFQPWAEFSNRSWTKFRIVSSASLTRVSNAPSWSSPLPLLLWKKKFEANRNRLNALRFSSFGKSWQILSSIRSKWDRDAKWWTAGRRINKLESDGSLEERSDHDFEISQFSEKSVSVDNDERIFPRCRRKIAETNERAINGTPLSLSLSLPPILSRFISSLVRCSNPVIII